MYKPFLKIIVTKILSLSTFTGRKLVMESTGISIKITGERKKKSLRKGKNKIPVQLDKKSS